MSQSQKAKRLRQIQAMKKKALELGFKSIIQAELAGHGNELKKAFINTK